MKIGHIRITDFNGVRKFQMTPAKVNILVGANGTGKSSVLQAIRYGITGNAPSEPIAGGCDKGVVELQFPDIGTLTRTVSSGRNEVRLNGKVTTQKSISELLEKRTGTSSTTAELMTSAEALSNLSSGELSAYLMENNLLAVKVKWEMLLSFCNMTSAGEALLKKLLPGAEINLGDIDQIWNQSKRQRRILKQEIQETSMRMGTKTIPIEESAEQVEDSMKQLLEEQGELQAGVKSYEAAKRERERVQREIREKEAKLGEDLEKPDENMIRQAENEIRRLDQEIINLQGVVTTIKTNGNNMYKILNGLSSDTCPISPKLKCSTDKTSIKAELQTEIDNLMGEYTKQKERVTELDRQKNEWYQTKNRLESQMRNYQVRKSLEEQIAYLREHMPEERKMPSAERIKEIAIQIEEMNKKRAAIIQNMTVEEHKLIVEEKKNQLNAYEELVRELDPRKGIRQKILERSLKPLEDYFNLSVRKILPKYKVRLDCSDGFRIELLDGDKVYDASKSASSGERARIWFVLMDLINALSSYRILVFDNTDGMDADALISFLDMLSSPDLQQRYDHIFVSVINYKEVIEYLTQKKEFSVIQIASDQLKEAAAA